MIFTLSLDAFIAANPGFAKWIISGLIACLAATLAVIWEVVYRRLGNVERAEKVLTGRVLAVEGELKRYEEHVGAGDRALNLLQSRIEHHMTEEENTVWTGIRTLTDKLSEMQVENVEAHAGLKERLAKVEEKATQIKLGQPNGEIHEILALLKKLATQ